MISAGICLAAEMPNWAYGYPPAGAAPAPAGGGGGRGQQAPDTTPKTLPGSTGSFTSAQIRDAFGPADWFPGEHPAMPDIVAHGKRPDVRACALCHLPNGNGRPENASVRGYPVAYFIQQMNDFRNGNRKSADSKKANAAAMITMAKAMTDEEIKAAAEYFGSMKWQPWIKVVETDTVPKTRSAGGLFVPLAGNEKEPIGARIIETPEDPEQSENFRNPHSGFIAYVPKGSVKKGEALAAQCVACHGTGLTGLGPVPGLAGRSPSYAVRQMYDMQTGVRHGQWAELMKPIVAKLSDEDMLNVAAYAASLKP
jgi:cytochrome c553